MTLISQYGHGICYNLTEKIEAEHAIDILNEQNDKQVIILEEIKKKGKDCSVALMIADNIDNLENNLIGGGTFHRVNAIPVKKQEYVDEEKLC